MKKRLMCLLLSWLIVFALALPAAGQSLLPMVTVLAVEYQDTTLQITYCVQNTVPDQEITCLVYERLSDGKQGTLLQVEQTSVQGAGVHWLTLFVAPSPEGYVLRFGGTQVTALRTVQAAPSYAATGIFITSGQTVAQLADGLPQWADLAISRDGQPLLSEETVLPGDVLSATVNGQSTSYFAVVPGDVNLDGTVNALDALRILLHAVNKTTLTGASLAAADFRQSGEINAVAALFVLQYAVDKVEAL